MPFKTMHDSFIHALSDVLSAEKQLNRMLPELAHASTNPKLTEAFKTRFEETRGQIKRLGRVVEVTCIKPKRRKCVAMDGLLVKAQEVIDEIKAGAVLDAALIAAARKVEHYEIASYGALVAMAERLGFEDAVTLLIETLAEEKAAYAKLTLLVEETSEETLAL